MVGERRHQFVELEFGRLACVADAFALLPVVEFGGPDGVARVREGRLTIGGEVPADVVAVQVGHHHRVDLVRPHALGLEVAQKRAPRHVGRVGRARTEPGVDEDRPAVGADQVGAEVEADPVLLREVRRVVAPVGLRDRGEEVAQVELEHAVRQHHDLDVADAYDVVGHGVSGMCGIPV